MAYSRYFVLGHSVLSTEEHSKESHCVVRKVRKITVSILLRKVKNLNDKVIVVWTQGFL